MAKRSSTGMCRSPFRPTPITIAAFSIERCASVEAYIRSRPIPGRPDRPSSRDSSPSTA